jgi:hypothetical protein
VSDEPRAPSRPEDERPPVLPSWGAWYGLVAGGLLAVILFCGWLAAHNA